MPQERIEKGKRVRACTICGRTFKRTEHCIRHERAHFRERPFTCRFCHKSYGRKDLLVRHERTLHADEWASAQANASAEASTRPPRQRPSRTSFNDGHTLPQINPQIEPQSKVEFPTGMRINDETIIRYESFLPSPRVSSSSEISEHEPNTRNTENLDVELPLDPNLFSGIYMAANNFDGQLSYQNPPMYSTDQRHASYDSQAQQPYMVDQFHQYQEFPIDPNIMENSCSQAHDQSLTSDNAENVNILALFPSLTLDKQTLTRYITESFSNKSTFELLGSALKDAKLPLDENLSESHHQGQSYRDEDVLGGFRPYLTITDDNRNTLLADLRSQYGCMVEESQIPDSSQLQGFIEQFFLSFNTRLPLFHLATFNSSTCPTPLLLMMCAIGALFNAERVSANILGEMAKQALQNVEMGLHRPLWEAQCKLLLIVSAAFGSDANAVNWALENSGFIQREFSSRKAQILAVSNQQFKSWSDWIDHESSKRLLFGLFIISSLLTLTYNTSPSISTTEELKIDMPSEEHVWMASNEGEWKAALAKQDRPNIDLYTALTTVVFGKEFDLDINSQWSPFAVTVLMHAVNVHMWHITQSTQSFMSFSADAKEEETMKALCTSQTEAALSRCYMILAHRKSPDGQGIWDDVEGPLLFNGMAVLRSCYVRAFMGTGGLDWALLFKDDEQSGYTAAEKFIQIGQMRSSFLSQAVSHAFEGVLCPIDIVGALAEKDYFWSSSIEHAVAMWDTALFYIKWVYIIEALDSHQRDHEERQHLETLSEFLRRNNRIQGGEICVAANLARFFAERINASWTWEVTCRMSSMLEKVAAVCENQNALQSTTT